jgi:iron complex outermembrane recepter protein
MHSHLAKRSEAKWSAMSARCGRSRGRKVMLGTCEKRSSGTTQRRASLPERKSLTAAVLFALYGLPHLAIAQQQTTAPEQQDNSLAEVIVTATHRKETLEAIPYSITAVSGTELDRSGVTDLASLASQVPGLNLYDLGARASASEVPVIRGINASNEGGNFRTYEQAPVGTYIGNSPIDGYFQLDDIQRVEVLRGPQGTLYGAGALGGAIRIIPNAPVLDQFSGSVEAGGGAVAHSGDPSYLVSALINIPIGETVAFRASAKYAYEPGFIDVYGILARTGSSLSGIPTLADPSDPVTSPGIFMGKKDWNDQNTFTGRASLLWEPSDKFNAQAALLYSNLNGDGGPTANTTFAGGAYPIDPRVTFPSGSNYQEFSAINQPYYRRTTLESLDVSYDAGFATLSSTSSYFTTNGMQTLDATYGLAALPGFISYYAGTPTNPRFVNPDVFPDWEHTFTQEVRLVSNTGENRKIDYVVGVFYENQGRWGAWEDSNPGSPEYSVQQGCTAPYAGGTFPNCQLTSGPGDVHFSQTDLQHFQDKSEFGEITWHAIKHGQITFGGRHFAQSFDDAQAQNAYTFDTFVPDTVHRDSTSKNTWKINPSYEYTTGQNVYALWSQGFRRGGVNALPQSGIYNENPQLRVFQPDSVNNYEVGLKGRLENDVTYSFDVFDIDWDKPQVGGFTPSGSLGAWNANKAKSTGAEFDINTPLFVPGLSIRASGAYTNARFTEDYSYAANNGGGLIVPGLIYGKAGQQLPGSSKDSVAATMQYNRMVTPGYEFTASLNDTYRSVVPLTTFPNAYGGGVTATRGLNLVNLSASLQHAPWRAGLYITNLADKRAIQVPGGQPTQIEGLANDATITRPREIQLRLRYSF